MKKAIIFGITGQDGSYLVSELLVRGYEVHGVIRRHSITNSTERIDHHLKDSNLKLHYGDITDSLAVSNIISVVKPDLLFNLAAQSHVKVSFEIPQYTANVDAVGTLNIMESIRLHAPQCKVYHASTSELYGGLEYNKNDKGFYDESCPFHPRSPYGVSKIYAYWIVKNYRESYNLFACNGILFNHESPRRTETFVTKKITSTFAAIKYGNKNVLKLGNLDSLRDWGYAKEYVIGMIQMLEQDKPDDYILSTGEAHTVREFVEKAAIYCGWDIQWIGEGVQEKGYDKITGKLLVEIDEKYFRPAEVDLLLGDYSKAKQTFGWEPKVKFNELVEVMMNFDLEKYKKN